MTELGFFLSPEFLAEIEVYRHGDTVTFGGLACQAGQFGSLVGDGGSDTRPVEPVCPFHDGIEIKVCSIRFGNGRVRTVINHLTGTHGSTGLKIVDTYTVATTRNEVRLYAILAQCIDSRLAYLMLRQLGYKISIMSVVGTTDSHVCLTAAIYHIKRVGLHETGVSQSRQPQHDFT